MNFNVTVQTRIILGFSAIMAVLFITGISSIIGLNDISGSTNQVKEISLPALTNSAKLQVQFLKMGENALEDFHAVDLATVDEIEKHFEQNNLAFDSESVKLQQSIKDNQQLVAALTSVRQSAEQFTSNVKILFESHRRQITVENQIRKQLESLDELVDDSSTQAMDITEIDGIKGAVVDAAESIETDLASLIELLNDISSPKTNSLSVVDTLAIEINALSSTLSGKVQTIRSGVSSDEGTEATAELDKLINQLLSKATGNNSIVSHKRQALNSYSQSIAALKESKQHQDEGVEQLNQLFSLAVELAKSKQQEVSDNVSSGQTVMIFAIIISFIIAVGITLKTVNSIIVPLRQVNSMLNIVASGDLTQRLNDDKQDEFGELARNCNSLIDSLKDLIQSIIIRSTQLAAASEETSAITTQTTQAIQLQRTQMEQAATATTEMTSTSQSVMHSAEEALKEVKHADSEAQRVQHISEQNKTIITKLASEVEEASKVINTLHQDSAAIGRILDVIRGIADQTNLLALNAAIEAARAGEQGRGFAVVADEVRSLASKTQASTQEIQNMIQRLQSGAQLAVEVMTRGKQQADSCVEQNDVANHALLSISRSVHSTYDVSIEISQAAQEQHQVSMEISKRLESIVSIAEETSTGADQTAISSHEVARLSEELRQSVSEFKV